MSGSENYAALATGQRPAPPRESFLPEVMKPRLGVGYTLVRVPYADLFKIKFYSREKLVDALHEHAVACAIERKDIKSLMGKFEKRLTRVRFMDDGVHVLLLSNAPPLSDVPNF